MTFQEIVGQERAIETLRATLRAGRIPNAYLFEGPWGVGKTRTAHALASGERKSTLLNYSNVGASRMAAWQI
jgi:DNA polymerase III gamma/tau subunit